MRYEVEMNEKARFVIEADDFVKAAEYLSTHRIHEIEKEQNTILLVEPDDRILGKTIMPADVSVRESL